MLAEDIAKLMNAIPVEEQTKRNEGMDRIEGGAFEGVMDKQTPFQVWILHRVKPYDYDLQIKSLFTNCSLAANIHREISPEK